MKKLLYFIPILLLSCAEKEQDTATKTLGKAIYGLASPITLDGDTTAVLLDDYFYPETNIDSLNAPKELDLVWSEKDRKCMLVGRLSNNLDGLRAYAEGTEYFIPIKNASKVKVTVNFTPYVEYDRVELPGDFNGWQGEKTPMIMDTSYSATLELYPGNYAYQISVDGKYMLDPNNPETRSNGMGGYNSILNVKPKNEANLPHLVADSVSNNSVYLSSSVSNNHAVALVNNQIIFEGSVSEHFSVELPSWAATEDRSYLRIWSGNETGVSNEVKLPLEKGNVVEDEALLTRNDRERMILYFMMVDRFYNGDTSIDAPVLDDRVAPRANYLGGDLAGIQQKLNAGYFDELGVNTIWVSPITQNPEGAYQEYPEPRRFYSGYHGYWPISFTKIDHRLGSKKVLHDLVDQAHEKNYNVILDFVSNHVHEEHPFIKVHPDYKTNIDLPDGSKNIRIWDAQRLTTWFDDFLPSFDYSRQEVIDVVSDSAVALIAEYGFDGFRHDATKHIPEPFWRATTTKLKALAKQTDMRYFQVGETFGDRALIQSYIGSGMMDGQFDFNVYFDARAVFQDTNVSFEVLASSIKSSINIHGAQHQMCNITGNHDLPRFISYAGKGIGYDEDEKAAGWERKVTVEDPVGYEKLKMLQTFVATIPGIPVIYYGDEIGMAGANDPDNRRMMRFDGLNEHEIEVKTYLTNVLKLRKNNLALTYGDIQFLDVSKDVMVYSRTYLNQQVITCFNNSDQPKEISIPLNSQMDLTALNKSTFSIENNTLTLTLKPFSAECLTTNL